MARDTAPAARPTSLLVPLDGSDLAECAVDHAAAIAAPLGATVVLFMALSREERSTLKDLAAGQGMSVDATSEVYLQRVSERVPPTVARELHVRPTEHPAAAILQFAADHRVSMIVAASHGRSGIGPWPLGSIAEKLVQSGQLPVLVVPVATSPSGGPNDPAPVRTGDGS